MAIIQPTQSSRRPSHRPKLASFSSGAWLTALALIVAATIHSSAKGRRLGEPRSRGAQVRQDFAIIDDFSGDLPAGLTQSTLIDGATLAWQQQVAWGDRVVWGDWLIG